MFVEELGEARSSVGRQKRSHPRSAQAEEELQRLFWEERPGFGSCRGSTGSVGFWFTNVLFVVFLNILEPKPKDCECKIRRFTFVCRKKLQILP